MKPPAERPPLYQAVVDQVDWEVRGRRIVLKRADEPTDEIPPKVAAWMLRCGAIEEVKRDDRKQ